MENKVCAGVIGCNMSEDFFQTSAAYGHEKLFVKKIHPKEKKYERINKLYPQAEIISNDDAIVNDSDISLVFVSAEKIELVQSLINSGKAVRVIYQ